MDLVTTAAAAAELGLSAARVRELITAGDLQATKVGNRWFVSRDDMSAFAEQDRPVGRPHSPTTAWALLALAVGRATPPVDPAQRSRLRSRLRSHPGIASVAAATRRRGQKLLVRAHPGVLEEVRSDSRVVLTGASAPGHDVVDVGAVELYIASRDLHEFLDEYRIRPADRGSANVTVAVPPDVWWPFNGERVAWPSVVAVDLFDSGEPRSARAARQLWARLLAEARWETDR